MTMPFKLTIGFLAAGHISFTGKTAAEKDLGGSEYACVKMAEALVARGHDVTVYTPYSAEAYPDSKEMLYNGVRYLASPDMWLPTMRFKSWDVFVVSRQYTMLTNSAINAKQLVLWNHDVLTDAEQFLEHVYPLDRMYCLSKWQKQQYLTKINAPCKDGRQILYDHQITVTRNGVDVEGIEEALKDLDRDKNGEIVRYDNPTFLYCSRPERGLLYLLRDIWPKLLEQLPDARLHVAFYNVDQEKLPTMIRQIHAECFRLIKQQPNVTFLGHMPRYSLYREMATVHALLYPSVFPEISCLSALESQACGTPAFTSSYAALLETNRDPRHCVFDKEKLLAGDVEHIEDAVKFIARAIELYNRYDWRERRKHNALMVRQKNSWTKIAEEWETDFYEHFEQRSAKKAVGIIENLIYNSDLLAARWTMQNPLSVFDDRGMRWIPEEYEDLAARIDNYLEHHHDEPEQYGAFVDIGDAEDITALPERMQMALDLIEERFGKEKLFTLLDVGCGSGRMLYHVMKNFPNAQVMGMDFSQKCLQRADANLRKLLPEVNTDDELCIHCGFVWDVHNLPGDDCRDYTSQILPFLMQGDFLECGPPHENDADQRPDCAFVGEWLEHQIDLELALNHVNAWVKPGGLVIYTVPNGPWEALTFGEAHTKDGHEIRFHVSHFEERDILEMFKDVEELSYSYAYIQRSAIDNAPIGQFVVAHKAANNLTFHTPDYRRKFLTTRPRPKIGACLIAKNEEHNILRALKPLEKRVDVIYVGDTGSTDRTVDLAMQHANNVADIGWDMETGFAGARNTIRDMLVADYDVDWILWIDADEEPMNMYALRKYLTGDLEIYQGFVLAQVHLMLDMPVSRDIPVRLFRNNSDYRFHGLIHEHGVNLGKDPDGNLEIFPTLILPDVELAHYGYKTEADRRWKVLNRNLPLLKKDLIANPNRDLGRLNLMRDYSNTVRWHLEKRQPDDRSGMDTYYLDMVMEIIQIYHEFKAKNRQPIDVAKIFYQDALRILGQFHIPLNGQLPIEAGIVLMAERAGLPQDARHVSPRISWFMNMEELEEHVKEHLQQVRDRLPDTNDIFRL